MPEKIAVTGATGKVGSEIVRVLQKQKYRVNAAVRDLQRGYALLGEKSSLVRFDFTDRQTWELLLDDVSRLFLMAPDDLDFSSENPVLSFIDFAQERGVERIVFLSVISAPEAGTQHFSIEQHIRSTSMEYAFLRPNWYMQNFTTYYRDEIAREGTIFIPAGRGRVSFIDTRDVASVAVRLLEIDRESMMNVYDLTGPEALDHYQAAEILSETLNRTIIYADPSPDEYAKVKKEEGAGDDEIGLEIELYRMVRENRVSMVTGTVGEVLARDPISFEQFARDYSWVFRE